MRISDWSSDVCSSDLNVEYFVDVASDYRSDFIVFPELFTLQLLAYEKEHLTPMEAIDRLTEHTPKLTAELSRMALRYNINIIDRKSVVKGKSVSVRVDLGGRRSIKKKKYKEKE